MSVFAAEMIRTREITPPPARVTVPALPQHLFRTHGTGRLVRVSTASGGGSVRGGEGYTLCEACFRRRSRFHPPHPFARLLPGFADRRLSMPAIYEAV